MNLDITVAKQLSKSRVNELRILYDKAETEKEQQEILDSFLDENNLPFTEAIIKRYNSHSHFAAPTEQVALSFAHVPTESEILEKIADLIHSGNFSDANGKQYKYKILSTVKEFVSELKTRNITDINSKQWIHSNILLPKNLADYLNEQVKWETFRHYFY